MDFQAFIDLSDYILPILAGLGLGAAPLLKKVIFYGRALAQAVEAFEDVKEANREIYDRLKAEGKSPELIKVLEGGASKLNGLSGIVKG